MRKLIAILLALVLWGCAGWHPGPPLGGGTWGRIAPPPAPRTDGGMIDLFHGGEVSDSVFAKRGIPLPPTTGVPIPFRRPLAIDVCDGWCGGLGGVLGMIEPLLDGVLVPRPRVDVWY